MYYNQNKKERKKTQQGIRTQYFKINNKHCMYMSHNKEH